MKQNFKRSAYLMRVVVFAGLLFGYPHLIAAQENPQPQGKETKEDDGKLKPGVVASFGKHPHKAAVSAIDTSESDEGGVPVVGSISRQKDKCIATLSNTTKDFSYSVNFAVIGTNSQGTQVFRRTYSASLKPQGSTTKEMSCGSDDNVRIEITSGRKLAK